MKLDLTMWPGETLTVRRDDGAMTLWIEHGEIGDDDRLIELDAYEAITVGEELVRLGKQIETENARRLGMTQGDIDLAHELRESPER